ncbi:unnamed protein product [Merluccius merluccius]
MADTTLFQKLPFQNVNTSTLVLTSSRDPGASSTTSPSKNHSSSADELPGAEQTVTIVTATPLISGPSACRHTLFHGSALLLHVAKETKGDGEEQF